MRGLGSTPGRGIFKPETLAMQPTHRVSYGRTRRRRSHHAMEAIQVGVCPMTGMPKLHHRVCAESGYVRPGLRIKVPKLGIGVPKE